MSANKYQISNIKNQKCKEKIKDFCIWVLAFYLISGSCVCFAQGEIVYEDKGKRDPFIALVTPDGRLLNLEPSGSETITLGGIIYDKNGRSYAIINKEVVSVGDFIIGHAVFEIEENKVILLKDNQPVEYILEKEEP